MESASSAVVGSPGRRAPAARILNLGVALLLCSLVILGGTMAIDIGKARAATTTCPCTLFPATAVPANIEANDGNAVELGVQFESSIPGAIVGVRFYKGPDNTGLHVGSLWTSDGTSLANADFTNETATGWQQVNFSSPVPVNANTLYVAGYHTNVGYYSYDPAFYTSNTYTNGPLSAPSNAAGSPNGLFKYSTTPVFPNSTFNGNNYWVDVIFVPTVVSIQVGVPQASPTKGTSEQLTATETLSDGSTADVTSQVAWSTSNANVSVSATGQLTALATGPTTVYAALNGVTGSANLTVLAPVVTLTTLSISAPSATLPTGTTEQLTATGTYSDGTTASLTSQVTWSSGTPSALSVSASGLATALSKGSSVTVTASLSGISGNVTVKTLAAPIFVAVTPTIVLVRPGQTVQLTATALLSDGSVTTVTPLVKWSLIPGVGLTISSSGLLTPTAPSINAATATLGRLIGVAAILVAPPAGGHN